MADLVAQMEPKSKAVVRREVGGFTLKIPVDFGRGKTDSVEIGVNLTSAPIDVFENNPVAAFKLRQALELALTKDILVKYGRGARQIEQAKFVDLLADVIIEKVRDTL